MSINVTGTEYVERELNPTNKLNNLHQNDEYTISLWVKNVDNIQSGNSGFVGCVFDGKTTEKVFIKLTQDGNSLLIYHGNSIYLLGIDLVDIMGVDAHHILVTRSTSGQMTTQLDGVVVKQSMFNVSVPLQSTPFSFKSTGFNGVDEYVSCGANAILGNSAFTISAWLKLVSHTQYGGAIVIGTSAGTQSAYLGYVSTAQVGTNDTIGGGFFGRNYGSGVLDLGWHHVALTYSGGVGGTTTLYVDALATVSETYTPNLGNTQITFGRFADGTPYPFFGNIDEVSLWNVGLTLPQIQEIYNLTEPTDLLAHSAFANLTNWWRMGENDTAPTIIDVIGTKDGTLVNMDDSNFTTDTISASAITTEINSFIVGVDKNEVGIKANIDDVRVYDKELTDSEMKTIHTSRGSDSIVDGVAIRWTFQENANGVDVQPVSGGSSSTTLPSGVVVDLDTSAIIGLNEGDPINQIPDISGNNFHANQTGINRATYRASILNNKGVAEFDGSDDYYDDAHSYSIRFAYCVFRVSSVLQNTSQLGHLIGNYPDAIQVGPDARVGATERGYSFDGSGSTAAQYSYDGNLFVPATPQANDNTSQWSYDTWHILAVRFSSTVAVTRQILGSLFPSFPVGVHHYGGDIAELVIFDRILNATEEQKGWNYLFDKWVITPPETPPSGGIIDISGNGLRGTPINTPKHSFPILGSNRKRSV